MKREELISICERAVVHHSKWMNRDSFISQKCIQSIYEGLTAGLDFKIVTKKDNEIFYSNDDYLVIEFIQPIDFDKLKSAKFLEISSLEDYFNDCDPNHETEMFDGEGIDFYSDYTIAYMPTHQRLQERGKGNDWY